MSYSDIDLDLQEAISDRGLDHLKGKSIDELRELYKAGKITIVDQIMLDCVSPEWRKFKSEVCNG